MRRISTVIGVITLALACWWAGFRLSSTPGSSGVTTFLIVFAVAWVGFGLALLGLGTTLSRSSGPAFAILAVGLGLRCLLVPAGMSEGVTWEKLRDDLTGRAVRYDRFLLYDHDVWRYLWDGHTQAVGLNPYRYAPADLEPYAGAALDPELDARLFPSDTWRDIWENINHKEVPTIYPPVLQWVFRLSHAVAPGSVVGWKLLLIGVDFAVGLALFGVARRLGLPDRLVVAAYAWNPLVLKEITGSGHADAIPALALVLALYAVAGRRDIAAGVGLGVGMLAKLFPGAIFLASWKRLTWRALFAGAATGAVGFAWFADAGPRAVAGLAAYSREWVFNPGIFEAFRAVALLCRPDADPTPIAKITSALFFFCLIIYLQTIPENFPHQTAEKWLLALGGLLFLSPTVMPWYFVWVLPLAAICRRAAWFVYAAASMVSYRAYIVGDGREPAWQLVLIHGVFCLAYAIEARFRRVVGDVSQAVSPARTLR